MKPTTAEVCDAVYEVYKDRIRAEKKRLKEERKKSLFKKRKSAHEARKCVDTSNKEPQKGHGDNHERLLK